MIEHCRQSADFVALRRGTRTGGRVLWMLYAPDPTLSHPRVAFAIGRRAGGAVQRNRLRRRIQAILRDLGDELAPGRYLFGARQPAGTITFSQARDDILHFVDRAAAQP